MDIRNYFSCKRTVDESTSSEPDNSTQANLGDSSFTLEHDVTLAPQKKKPHLSSTEKRLAYKAKLSYKKKWEDRYPWVTCENPTNGMFCSTCQKWGYPPTGPRGDGQHEA